MTACRVLTNPSSVERDTVIFEKSACSIAKRLSTTWTVFSNHSSDGSIGPYAVRKHRMSHRQSQPLSCSAAGLSERQFPRAIPRRALNLCRTFIFAQVEEGSSTTSLSTDICLLSTSERECTRAERLPHRLDASHQFDLIDNCSEE